MESFFDLGTFVFPLSVEVGAFSIFKECLFVFVENCQHLALLTISFMIEAKTWSYL